MTIPPTDAIRKCIAGEQQGYANWHLISEATAELQGLLDALKEAGQWKAIATQLYKTGRQLVYDPSWKTTKKFEKATKAYESALAQEPG